MSSVIATDLVNLSWLVHMNVPHVTCYQLSLQAYWLNKLVTSRLQILNKLAFHMCGNDRDFGMYIVGILLKKA